MAVACVSIEPHVWPRIELHTFFIILLSASLSEEVSEFKKTWTKLVMIKMCLKLVIVKGYTTGYVLDC